VFLRLVLQVVGNGSEERTGTLQATFDVALTQVADEGNHIKRTFFTWLVYIS